MLEVGLTREDVHVVTEEDLATKIYFRASPVYASAKMIEFAELVCGKLLAEHLDEGETSVGTKFEFTHEAATLCGMKVTMRATLVEFDGRRCVFDVEGRNEVDRICVGRHEQFVVKREKFLARLEGMAARRAS